MTQTHHPSHRKTLSVASLTGALLLGLAGCTVGPNFTSPKTVLPETWSGPAEAASATAQGDLAEWWNAFEDAQLTALIEEALDANLDLRIAAARIRQARADRGIAASGRGPALGASGAVRRGRGSGDSPTTTTYQAGFDASWEIDIFGGVRRSVEAAEAALQAAVEDRRDVQVVLAAEVARNYVTLRATQQRLAVARKNLEAQRRSAELTRVRHEGGLVSALDVAHAEGQVASTAAQIPRLESAAQQTIHALSVLLDREPGALVAMLAPPTDIPVAPPSVPLGVPSDLLRRRPDIRRAEADIHTATARIGIATADLYPSVNILGSLGWQAANSGDLFSPISRFWSLGPSVSWNLFQSGRTLSNIELQRALQEQSILTFRQTVLRAIQEVENALIASAMEQERREHLEAAVTANRKAVALATQLYSEGQTDFLSVLSAQSALYASEDSLVAGVEAAAVEMIALYKALGGGWEAREDAARGRDG